MAATDLLTLAEAKRVLRLSPGDSSEDVLLQEYVSAASDLLDEHVGPTIARAVTGEAHDGMNRYATGLRTVVVLRHRPVLSIGTVVVDGASLTQTNDYLAGRYQPDTTLYSGQLRRLWGGIPGPWDFGSGNIVCSYTAGRVASTTAVEPRFKRACGLVLQNLWRDREIGVETFGEYDVPRASFPTFAMPKAAAQLLTREMGFQETYGVGGG